jgi:hypothetical protein
MENSNQRNNNISATTQPLAISVPAFQAHLKPMCSLLYFFPLFIPLPPPPPPPPAPPSLRHHLHLLLLPPLPRHDNSYSSSFSFSSSHFLSINGPELREYSFHVNYLLNSTQAIRDLLKKLSLIFYTSFTSLNKSNKIKYGYFNLLTVVKTE